MMRDLDIVVPGDRFEDCVAAMRALGYDTAPGDWRWTYHYPELYRKGAPASVDLHRHIGEQRSILGAEEAFSAARPVEIDGVRARLLSPTHQILHNIVHSEIQDRGHELGIVWLRQLLVLAGMIERGGECIDWADIARRMDEAGLSRVLAARIHLAGSLLGAPLPDGITFDRRARRHADRCMRRYRWEWLVSLQQGWAGMTEPFKRHHLDFIYACGTGSWRVNLTRIRHAWRLFWRYRGRLIGRVSRRSRAYG